MVTFVSICDCNYVILSKIIHNFIVVIVTKTKLFSLYASYPAIHIYVICMNKGMLTWKTNKSLFESFSFVKKKVKLWYM